MVVYAPRFKPGIAFTRTAAAAVTAGQLLIAAAADGCDVASAITAAWIGIAADDAASGARVTVLTGGVQRPTAGGTIAVGDIVVAAATGRVVTNAAPGAGQQVGVALSAATVGQQVDVLMSR
jgi:hypothetical protein